jgi:glycosyltransferase involved in cell wall biosynthesis
MSQRVHVSVVVSTFQRRDALRNTIDSLLNQQVPSGILYDIIIVDNNCTDGTGAMVAEYLQRYPDRIQYIVEGRQGVSYGRNTGVAASTGEIVAFTDDDNVVERGWVATICRLLEARPDLAGVGGRVVPGWFTLPPDWLDSRHWAPLAILDYGDVPFATSARKPLSLLTANLALRRSTFLAVGGFSPAFARCVDHELLIRLWQAGERVLYSPRLVVYAPVDRQRLTRRYHRLWHTRYGRYAAAMDLEDANDAAGRLRPSVPDTVRIAGTAGHVFAEFPRDVAGYVLASLRRQPAAAAQHEFRIRYLVSYVKQRRKLTSAERRPLLFELAHFIRKHLDRRARSVRMSAGRIAAVHAVLAVLIGGSAYDIVSGREHWPLSPYPMFSSVERNTDLRLLLLRGVTDEAVPREIALRDASVIGPFDQCRIITALSRVKSAGDSERLHAMLGGTLARYDAQRSAGVNEGPPLKAIRLYDAVWTLRADAANRETPDEARLVDEFVAGK